MGKLIGLGIAGVIAVGAIYVFFIWKPLASWHYAEVLPEVQKEFGADRQVIAVEVGGGTGGDVAFVMRAPGGRVEVRHYWQKCGLRSGGASNKNGSEFRQSCSFHTRQVSTYRRRATRADRGPAVRLGAFTQDAIDRLEDDGGKPGWSDLVVFWRGRWRFTPQNPNERLSAKPDGSDIKGDRALDSGSHEQLVRGIVGDPPS